MQNKIVLLVLTTLLLSLNSCYIQHRIGGKTKAQPSELDAPDIRALSSDGTTMALSDFKGKVVLLHFWASWCYSCVHELQTLQNLYKALNGQNFEILSIAVDDKWEDVHKVRNKLSITFPMLLDADGSIKKTYKVTSLPETYLVGKNGRLQEFHEPENKTLIKRSLNPQRWDQQHVFEEMMTFIKK